LIDVGLAHTLTDTYLSNKSKTVHAKAANAYAKQKRTGYEKEIAEKSLDYLYKSFCLEPPGAFGDDAWRLIRERCQVEERDTYIIYDKAVAKPEGVVDESKTTKVEALVGYRAPVFWRHQSRID
jgi:hypothetical protein